MRSLVGLLPAAAVAVGALVATAAPLTGVEASRAYGQAAGRDGIADLIRRAAGDEPRRLAQAAPTPKAGAGSGAGKGTAAVEPTPKDPREGDAGYEQARRLMGAIDAILQDTAKQRSDASKLPSKNEFVVPPLWTETREDREQKVRDLLDAALGVVTDTPVVEVQKRIETLRRNITDLEGSIVKYREKQLTAPKDSLLPGVLADTIDSLATDIEAAKKKIEANRTAIGEAKAEVHAGLEKSGVKLKNEQVDMLLESVLSGDLVRLVATFDAAKVIDTQLGKLMASSGDNLAAARKYFAMHAALFALLVRAQESTIAKIDTQYMPKLDAILKDIVAARQKTTDLMRAENRPDQRRTLEANRESQKVAEEAAKGYRRYLMQQREQIARARQRATHDLKIADNTYETVEASFQLRNLMRDSTSSFEAIQRLEAPTFEQIFKNEDLRREFENLTRKLGAPTS